MKTENRNIPPLVRVESDGAITPEIEAELKAIAAIPDADIDYSDIPPITDFSGFEIGKFTAP